MKVIINGEGICTKDVRPIRYFEFMGEKFVVHRSLDSSLRYTVSHYCTGYHVFDGYGTVAAVIGRAIEGLSKIEEDVFFHRIREKPIINQ